MHAVSEAAPLVGDGARAGDPFMPAWLRPAERAMRLVNRAMLGLGMLALLASAIVLTSSVVTRYFLHASTDWQDETAVFCLVGATFLTGAFVQSLRGHIGIEAVSGLLPAWANRLRQVIVDLVCVAFCAFFAWKSWTLFHEAWVDGQTTSSSWAPPLWIPYALMSSGMTLFTLQLLLQTVASCNAMAKGGRR
jgi:TRAP-type C4-dicarboxylate transport system permease small subunit